MLHTGKKLGCLVLLLVCQINSAQFGSQEKGDYLFSQFSYARAIPEYQKMVEADFNSDYAHQRLAECYLLMRNFKKSIPHFEKVIENPNIPTDYYFKYGMALYSDGDSKGAAKWLKKYKKYNANDSRVKKFLKNGSLASVVFNSRERYDIKPASFNSTESDFGVFIRGEQLYFASSRKDQIKGDVYGWNDEPWLDLFVVNENDDLSVPVKLKGDVNSQYHESSLVFSTDYKNDTIIYFTRNSYYKNKKSLGIEAELNLKIFSAIQESGEWVVNRNLPINSDYYSTGHPFVTKNRKRLYYTSDRPGGYGGTDIYYSEFHERGGMGLPINAGPIVNTEGNEMFPFLKRCCDKTVFYRQSDVPQVTELAWYLSCFFPYQRLTLAHSFKDKADRLEDVNAGLFTYPMLMAADILLYDAEIIPVGKDQMQHIEMTRDVASRFHAQLGETFVIPEVKVQEDTMYVPGTDGEKMSKSKGNLINLFQTDKKLRKQLMGIVSDSTPMEDAKNPENDTTFALYKILASQPQIEDMSANYLAGDYGYGHAKQALYEVVVDKFGDAREKYAYYMNNLTEIDAALDKGAQKARKVADGVLHRVRNKVGY